MKLRPSPGRKGPRITFTDILPLHKDKLHMTAFLVRESPQDRILQTVSFLIQHHRPYLMWRKGNKGPLQSEDIYFVKKKMSAISPGASRREGAQHIHRTLVCVASRCSHRYHLNSLIQRLVTECTEARECHLHPFILAGGSKYLKKNSFKKLIQSMDLDSQ